MKITSSHIKSFNVETDRLEESDITEAFKIAGADVEQTKAMIESLRQIAVLASSIEGLALSLRVTSKRGHDQRKEIDNLSIAEKSQLPLSVLNEIGKGTDSISRHANVFPPSSSLAEVTIFQYLNRPYTYWINKPRDGCTSSGIGKRSVHAIDEAIEKLGITAKHPATFIECIRILIEEESIEKYEYEKSILAVPIETLQKTGIPLGSLEPIIKQKLCKSECVWMGSSTLAELASMSENDFISLGTIQIVGKAPSEMRPGKKRTVYGFVEFDDKDWLREIFQSIQRDLKQLGIM